MAFCSKLGGVLRQRKSHDAQSPLAYMLNSFRFMSANRLFVGGLSFRTDDSSLKDAFSIYGDVVEATVIVSKDSRRSRGFGFVSFSDQRAASAALSAMDGQELQGRIVRVSYADERPGPHGGNGGDGAGGGYFGGGSYGGNRGGSGEFGGDF